MGSILSRIFLSFLSEPRKCVTNVLHDFPEVNRGKEHYKEVVRNQSDTPYVILNSKVDLEEVIVDNELFINGQTKNESTKNNGA